MGEFTFAFIFDNYVGSGDRWLCFSWFFEDSFAMVTDGMTR